MSVHESNIYSNKKKCKNCHSSLGTVKNGFKHAVNEQNGEKERVQRYKCKHCHKVFYPESSIGKSEKTNEKKQVQRLILHLYISGKTKGEITKALQEYSKELDFENVNDYINNFFNELSPSVKKFLNEQRPDNKIMSYHQCINKIADEPSYSLYLQEGKKHLAYTLFFSNMPSIVNILLDNLLSPLPVFCNYLRREVVKELNKAWPSNIYEIIDIVTKRLKKSSSYAYSSELNELENRLKEAYGYTYYKSYKERKNKDPEERYHIEQEEYYNPDRNTIYLKKQR